MKFVKKILKILKKRREEQIPEISVYPYLFKTLIIHNPKNFPKNMKEDFIIDFDKKNKMRVTPFWLENTDDINKRYKQNIFKPRKLKKEV